MRISYHCLWIYYIYMNLYTQHENRGGYLGTWESVFMKPPLYTIYTNFDNSPKCSYMKTDVVSLFLECVHLHGKSPSSFQGSFKCPLNAHAPHVQPCRHCIVCFDPATPVRLWDLLPALCISLSTVGSWWKGHNQ